MNGRARANKLALEGDRYWLNIKRYWLSELKLGCFRVPQLGKLKDRLENHWIGC